MRDEVSEICPSTFVDDITANDTCTDCDSLSGNHLPVSFLTCLHQHFPGSPLLHGRHWHPGNRGITTGLSTERGETGLTFLRLIRGKRFIPLYCLGSWGPLYCGHICGADMLGYVGPGSFHICHPAIYGVMIVLRLPSRCAGDITTPATRGALVEQLDACPLGYCQVVTHTYHNTLAPSFVPCSLRA